MKWRLIVLIVIVLLIAAGIFYLLMGYYNVAATQPHWQITLSFLEEVRERSIAFHSKGIKPPSLDDPKLLKTGFRHYHETCRLCHGAPALTAEEFAQGLNPIPPDLSSEDVQGVSDGVLFWIVKNGIKMTGMPASGPTHKDDALWGVIKFLRRLPDLKPEQYKQWVETAGLQKTEDHHH